MKRKLTTPILTLLMIFLLVFIYLILINWKPDFGVILANPKGSIVFRPNPELNKLGFSDSDGNNIEIHKMNQEISMAVWSNDGRHILGLGGHGAIGYPIIWDLNSHLYKRCQNSPYYFQVISTNNPERTKEVVLSNSTQIIIKDIFLCEEIKVVVDDDHYDKNYKILGVSYNPENQTIVFGIYIDHPDGWRYQIVIHEIATGFEEVIAYGVNPSWSNSGNQIAFFGEDGLMYRMEPNGSDIQLINGNKFYSPVGYFIPEKIPIIQWSPEDHWILYHRCDDLHWENPENCSIYKMNMKTGEETVIIDQGMFPDWNPTK